MLAMMRKHGIVLALFSALATALTGSIHFLTKDAIAQQRISQQQKLFDQILPADSYDNVILNECYIVTNKALGNSQPHRIYLGRKQGVPSVIAIESTSPDGYSGPIHLLIGADFQGNVYGVRVTEHHETPGLGDKIDIRISDWITRFSGKTVLNEQDNRWAVKKDGGQFDQFTGATITPRAVIKSVKQTVLYFKQQDIELLPRCEDSE